MFFTSTLVPPDTMSYVLSDHVSYDNDTLNAMLCDNDHTNLSNKSCFDVTSNTNSILLASHTPASNVMQPKHNTTLEMLTTPIVNLGVNNISS